MALRFSAKKALVLGWAERTAERSRQAEDGQHHIQPARDASRLMGLFSAKPAGKSIPAARPRTLLTYNSPPGSPGGGDCQKTSS